MIIERNLFDDNNCNNNYKFTDHCNNGYYDNNFN